MEKLQVPNQPSNLKEDLKKKSSQVFSTPQVAGRGKEGLKQMAFPGMAPPKSAIAPKRNFDQHPMRHLILNPYISESALRKHTVLLAKGLHYSTKCIRLPSLAFVENKKVAMKPKPAHTKHTLVLDLDETLVYNCQGDAMAPDVLLYAADPHAPGGKSTLKFKLRPFVNEFLEAAAKNFEVVLFTASSRPYAKVVIDHLDPHKKIFNNILSREHCMQTKNGFFIKDLRILADRDMKNMFIIDNLVHCFGFQLENGFPILEYRGEKEDEELKYFIKFLEDLHKAEDVVEFTRTHVRLLKMAEVNLEALDL